MHEFRAGIIVYFSANSNFFRLLYCVSSKPPLPYKHDHNFMGEYSANILNMKPAEVADFLYWMVSNSIGSGPGLRAKGDWSCSSR